MASNKKQIKQLTLDLIRQSADSMAKNLNKALESGAIAIDEYDMKHNRLVLPKAIITALLFEEIHQYSCRGTSFENVISEESNNILKFI